MGRCFTTSTSLTPHLFFPVGLVKIESDWSVETGLKRWTLVLAVTIVDAYHFFDFVKPDLSPWGYGNKVLTGCTVPPDSKETEHGSSNREASPSAGKNTGAVLVLCSHMEMCPYSHFWIFWIVVDISEVLGWHLLQQMSYRWVSQKLLQRLVSHELTAYLSVFNLF